MKKISFLALAFFTLSVLHAQKINIGLKGGLNLATLDNSQDNNIENRVAYHAGLFANIPASSQIAIQPEVIYSSQGAKYPIGNEKLNLTLNYVNIPVMVQAMVGRGFYAELGPQLGILTGVADKINDTELGSVDKNDFKSTDVALGFGVGFKGVSGFGIDARYNLGLTNINNSGGANIKNNVLQVGLQLQLGR
ncbi:MAG: PorT family protein [Chitinophagaceae bacterium]|nr:MAG: PorT family protein [Chitinophagaceae bacterium]